jgi:hypothetical protein
MSANTSGAFAPDDGGTQGRGGSSGSGSTWYNYTNSFDVSRVVPTGNDNRPQNVYVNYIIKY